MNIYFIPLLLSLTLSIQAALPTDSQIQGRLNIVNGASSECVIHSFFERSDWKRIEGEIGRNGIDGLYYKNRGSVISEVLVAESKWNKARLGRSGKNKVIRQMSQEWILNTLRKLENKYTEPIYPQLKKLITHEQYRARLFTVKPRGKRFIVITLFNIKNRGSSTFDLEDYQSLEAIDLHHPRNSFEREMLESYNGCRTKYLKKYLPILQDEDIALLLEDNYLQKGDIKKILSTY